VDEIVDQGTIMDLIDGLQLRIDDVGWYSRLSILDDWTIPFIYGWMILAALALSVTVFTRQQYVVAAAHAGPEGATLAVRMRLWRHSATTRDEITEALTEALNSKGDEAE
jgi:hypothetical protein